jgi:hypothetical protein
MVNAAKAYIPAAGHISERCFAGGFATFCKNPATIFRFSRHKPHCVAASGGRLFEALPMSGGETGKPTLMKR